MDVVFYSFGVNGKTCAEKYEDIATKQGYWMSISLKSSVKKDRNCLKIIIENHGLNDYCLFDINPLL